MHQTRPISGSWLAALLAMLLPASGCVLGSTEVIVEIDTNAPGNRVLDLTASVGTLNSSAPARQTWVRGPTIPGSISLPASFAIIPAAGTDPAAAVTLVLHLHMEAGASGEPVVDFERTARFHFTAHQPTVVRIYLPVECGAASHGCAGVGDAQCTVARRCSDLGQTCNNTAACAPLDVTPVALAQDDAGDIVPMHPDVPAMDVPIARDVMEIASNDTSADADAAHDDVPPPRDMTVVDACSGPCTPGMTRMVSCGNCGTETDTCSALCTWTSGSCVGAGSCAPGATRNVSCGPCATETDTCSAACAWVPGSCNGSCCTPHAGCAGGNPIGGVCAGNGDDGCGGACTCNAVNGESCNTSSGFGSCCHDSGWFCADQSQCCPGLTCTVNICR